MKNIHQHKSNYKFNSNAYETQTLTSVTAKPVLTKINAYGTKPGFYGPEK